MTPGIHGDPGAALLEVQGLRTFRVGCKNTLYIFNFKLCASPKISMVVSNN